MSLAFCSLQDQSSEGAYWLCVHSNRRRPANSSESRAHCAKAAVRGGMQGPELLLRGQWLGPTNQPRHEEMPQCCRASLAYSQSPGLGMLHATNCQVRHRGHLQGHLVLSLPLAMERWGRSREHHYVYTGCHRPPLHTVATGHAHKVSGCQGIKAGSQLPPCSLQQEWGQTPGSS